MFYYYVRYNLYHESKPPAEQESWLQFFEHKDESGIKEYLTAVHKLGVTIIRSIPIDEQQYLQKQKENY